MLSVSHKSSSNSDSGSAANVQRKMSGQKASGSVQGSVKPQNSNTASLQRIIQNGASASAHALVSSIQPKLTIGKPGDKYEVEAESKADRVMAMAAPTSERVPLQPAIGDISRMVQPQAEEEELQMQPVEEEEPGVQIKLTEKEEPDLQSRPLEEEKQVQQPTEEEELQAQSEEEELVQAQLETEEEEVRPQPIKEDELQRRESSNIGSAEVGSSFESTLTGTKSSGDPLPEGIRSYMEPRFGADFSNVRIHTGREAAKLSRYISAQAFTHGRDIYFNEGKYDPDSGNGKHLIAHELTHTIQQGAAVQTKRHTAKTTTTSSSGKVQRSWLGDAWDAVSGAASSAVEWVGDSLEAGKDWLLGWLKERVDDVPGYKLLTVVLSQDPLTKKHVPRNGRNFIEAGLDIIPNGETYKKKLEEQGNLAKAVKWLDKQLATLKDVSPGQIAKDFKQFWSGLSLTDVRHPDNVLKRLLGIFSRPINRIIQFAKKIAGKFLEIVKDFLLSKIVAFIKKKQSPSFYPLLTVVLGHDPVTGKEVDRSGKNILTGFIKLHPDGDKQLKQMKKTKSFDRAVKWINTSITRIRNIATGLKGAFLELWNAVTDINTLLDPSGTFERIYTKFRTPLVELADFLWTVGKKILTFIKDALLSRLSAFARNTRGYPLITVILGRDPFTQKVIPRTIENIIKGFFSLMENGEQKFKKLKQSGAIGQMTSWMSGAIERLGITWDSIVGLFKAAWDRLTIDALANPVKAFIGIVKLFAPPIQRLLNFVVEVIKKVIGILLQIMNFPVNLISSIFEKTVSVFGLIKSDPIGFIKNLLRGLKQGFQQFFANIATHLLNGLTDWLFGTLEETGIKPPPDLSLKSILGLVMEILGITKDRIFDKIAQKIGREKMERIRGFIDKLKGIWAFVKDVMTRGPVAIWEYVREKISNLWNLVFEQVKSWIMEKIITKVTTKLLSMLDPTGVMAVVNSFIAIYNAIESFIAHFTRMLKMVNRFVEGVAAIARGNLASAANKLENSLSRGIPIAIGFLANQVGLSSLGKKIGKMIEKVRAKVNGAIDWLIGKAVKAGGAVLHMVKSAASSVKETVANLFGGKTRFKTESGETHSLYVEEISNSPRLMLASTPKTVQEFLNFYERDRKDDLTKTQQKHLEAAKEILKDEVNPLIVSLENENNKDESSEEEIRSIQQKLLKKEAKLANRLRLLLQKDKKVGKVFEKYALEGLTGTYVSMPKPTGDDFTADHQPQAAILEEATEMEWFQVEGINNMRNIAANRAASGYAINLHKFRHEAGRTFGSKGKATKNEFLNDVKGRTSPDKSARDNRIEVVNIIKNHLDKDVEAMKRVIGKDDKHENWKDINEEFDLSEKDKKEVIKELRTRIGNGESRLTNQDMKSLAE